jgi:hypothetical protein
LKLKYIAVPDGAAVLSCEGAGSSVRLPDTVGGRPVRELCPYAFSSPQAALARLSPGTEIFEALTGDALASDGAERFLGGESLREIRLPAGLRSIGAYAFYNCTGLSRVVLGGGPAQVGNGAFMNCAALEKMIVPVSAGAKTCLQGVLAEVQREVRVVFRCAQEESVWIFPEYYEESVENCPARIFEHFIHGAGFRYRQCFREDRLDAESYDAQFRLARSETARETLLCIALSRLRRPFRLLEPAEEQYRSYLKDNAAEAALLLVREDDPDGLSLLAANGVFTLESLAAAAEEASRLERAECLSILLDERHRRFAPKKKTFDL